MSTSIYTYWMNEVFVSSCLNIPRGASQRWTSARSEDILRDIRRTTDEQQRNGFKAVPTALAGRAAYNDARYPFKTSWTLPECWCWYVSCLASYYGEGVSRSSRSRRMGPRYSCVRIQDEHVVREETLLQGPRLRRGNAVCF